MEITPEQQEQINEIFKQLDVGMCEVIVLEDNGDFSNRMIFQTPMEALDIIKDKHLFLKSIDINKRELAVTLTGADLWFIKFNDLKPDEAFSLI